MNNLYIDDDYLTHISKNLELMRKELSFTQKQMAQKIAVTEYQYRKYEQGIDFLPLHIANRWMFFTGATIQSLFSNELDGILGDENNKHVYVFSYFCSRLSAERFKSLLILLFGINEAGYSQNYSDLDVGIDAGQFNFSNVEFTTKVDMDYYAQVAENLRKFRLSLQLTQDDMAEYLRISKRTYQNYEKPSSFGKIPIFLPARIHHAFDVNPSFISDNTIYKESKAIIECRSNKIRHLILESSINRLSNIEDAARKLRALF